jgi:hypothetical protein
VSAAPAAQALPMAPLRPPEQVMRLARMGSFFPTRLSFMPTLLRLLHAEKAAVRRSLTELDRQGYGVAVYTVRLGGHDYSLVAFSHQLAPEMRTDRVIAEAWDATFVLFDGIPQEEDLKRLAANAPRQEAGRYLPCDLVLSRANRSVRFFDHVVERLARGLQPDEALLGSVGYLMRTTAVYGNGKFGIADRDRIQARPGLDGPFRAEMLTVYLIRCFTHDLVEHIARARAPGTFVPLDRRLKRHVGIGNSTGLGMAPFLVSHPALIHSWMLARETALARVRSIESATPDKRARFDELLARAIAHVGEWVVEDARQSARIAELAADLTALAAQADLECGARNPWDGLIAFSESRLSLEAQEMLVALLIETYPGLSDDLAYGMMASHGHAIEAGMTLGEVRALVERNYQWALGVDLADRRQQQLFWYTSEEKLEPRLGDRFAEPGAEKEMPHAIARDVQALALTLQTCREDERVAAFLMRHPEHRHIVRRVQTTARYPYGEIRDNLVAADCLPIDLLRCKLSFFGASKFDPKSDRWTRITMYQGAPLADELADDAAQDWCFPVAGRTRP